MSDTLSSIAVGSSRCPYCGARPGRHCTSPRSGRRARYTHQARIEPARLGYLLGYQHGTRDVLDRIARDATLPLVEVEHLRRAYAR